MRKEGRKEGMKESKKKESKKTIQRGCKEERIKTRKEGTNGNKTIKEKNGKKEECKGWRK